jgi:hypothetical protein
MRIQMNFDATASVLKPNHFVPIVNKDRFQDDTITNVTIKSVNNSSLPVDAKIINIDVNVPVTADKPS